MNIFKVTSLGTFKNNLIFVHRKGAISAQHFFQPEKLRIFWTILY